MIKTVAVLLAGIISISFAAIFIRFCDDVPSIMIAAYRLTAASVILLAFFRLRGHTFKKVTREDFILSLFGGFFLALHFILWITSLKYTSVASSVVLVTTNPIFVGIFSYLLLKEKQNIELIIGIILCLTGSILIAAGDSGFERLVIVNRAALLGDILAFAGAIMASGYLLVGSKAREKLDILTYITIVYTVAALILIILSLVLDIPFTGYRNSSYLYMVLLAIVPQLIGHTAFNWALKHIKASMIAITILGEPIGATILAYLFFNESMSRFQLIGVAAIFAAILISSRKGEK
ncbi:MAG: DMT family transporter [Thermodesulfobacteriota bacterium]|nr:DMT family transporter [Thermodesulfobacteriota bacterium]